MMFRRIRCKHLVARCVHGDEINAAGGARCACIDCGRYLDGVLETCSATGAPHSVQDQPRSERAIRAQAVEEIRQAILAEARRVDDEIEKGVFRYYGIVEPGSVDPSLDAESTAYHHAAAIALGALE